MRVVRPEPSRPDIFLSLEVKAIPVGDFVIGCGVGSFRPAKLVRLLYIFEPLSSIAIELDINGN